MKILKMYLNQYSSKFDNYIYPNGNQQMAHLSKRICAVSTEAILISNIKFGSKTKVPAKQMAYGLTG